MYLGPNRSPLLPPDFDNGDNPDKKPDNNPDEKSPDEQKKPIPEPQQTNSLNEVSNEPQNSKWTQAKKSMSHYASGNAGNNGRKVAVRDYVKGHGGSSNAARSAKSGIRTTINIGDFFNNVSSKGINQVLNDYQIPFEGRKPKEILNDIVNAIAPIPNTNEDAVARKALIDTMSIIYEKFDDENKDISLLDSKDTNIADILITKYIETYIYERLLNELGSRIEVNSENSLAAAKIEKELKEYIEVKVTTILKDKPLTLINSQTNNVNVLVEGLYQLCYKVLEDQL